MFYQTGVLHVTHNGGTMRFDRRKRELGEDNVGWHIELNGVHRVLTSDQVKNMSEEEFLQFLSREFNLDVTNLPRLEKGGKRKTPPKFYKICKLGRPPKNQVRGDVQVVVVKRGKNATQTLREEETNTNLVPDDVNILT